MTTNRNDHPPSRPSITVRESIVVTATVQHHRERPKQPRRTWPKAIAFFPVCVFLFGMLPAGIFLNVAGLAAVDTPLWYWFVAITAFGTPITAVAYVTGFFAPDAETGNASDSQSNKPSPCPDRRMP